MGPRGRITVADLPQEIGGARSGPMAESGPDLSTSGPLRDAREKFEKWYIAKKLLENGGNVTRTAEALGLERSHLHRKLRAYGIGGDRQAGARGAEPAVDGSGGTVPVTAGPQPDEEGN